MAPDDQTWSMGERVERGVGEQGDRVSGSDRGCVGQAIAGAKKALESNEKPAMDKARETLTQASHKLAEQMYKAAQAPGAAPSPEAGPEPGANGGPKKDEGVIDAEYVDVEDKK